MKKKKNLFIIIGIISMCLFLTLFFINFIDIESNNTNTLTEGYTPQEEISDEQMRNTVVSLYFTENSSNTIKSEGRLIDSRELLINPYKTLTQLLIDGPKTETLVSVFPEGTKIIETSFENGNVTLNFSPEILNFSDDTQKYNIINTLLSTLSELNEVNSFNIIINNEFNQNFSDTYSVIY